MSLQVWLPLNGDLHNQGLAGELTCPNTLTFSTSGKIGEKCLNSYTGWFSVPAMTNKKQMSFSYWVKINEGTTTDWLDIFSWQTTDGTNSVTSRQELYYYNTHGNTNAMTTGVWYASGSGTSATSNSSHTQQPIGEWIHYTFTIDYNTGETNFYINGILKKTNQTAGINHYIKSGPVFRLRESALNCSINDFRLYDHCLSPKEVEEISKGLVLHYQLNEKYDGIDYNGSNYQNLNNCYSYPTFNTSNSNGGWSHWGRTGASGTQGQNTNKNFIYNQQNTYSHWVQNATTATGEYLLYQSPAFDGGLRSLQAIVKEENSVSINENVCFPAWNARNGGAIANLWTSIINLGNGFYLCKCEGISQDGSNDLVGIYVKPGYKIYFSEVYLENNQSTCTNILSYSSSTIYDCSGYKNNGQIVNQITPIESTPKYSTAISIIKNSYIKCTPFYFNTNQWTISHWYYKPTNPTSYECFYCLSKGNGADANKKFAAMPNTGRVWYKGESGSTSISQLQINAWTFLALVCDGTTVIVYQNGEQIGSFAASTAMTDCQDLGIGVRANSAGFGTVACPSEFVISDFRIYATPLTVDQIKELYNTSATIDNNGNIYTRDFIENDNLNITKTGLFQTSMIEDDNNGQASIFKTKKILGTNLYEY